MTLAEKLARVKELVSLFRRDAEDGIGTMAMISVGQTKMAAQAFEPGKGHIPILVRAALLQRLLMTVTRLHDKMDGLDSLPVLFDLLSDPAVRSGALPYPELEPPLAYAFERWSALQPDPRIDRLRLFRNRYLAHSVSKKWGFDKPVFEDITSAALDTFAIVEALGIATATAPSVLKHVANIWKERADEYWKRLARKSS
jgi:hypothetical protein